ncbi:MAG TPA: hypothetical protein VJH97_04825 [Candidatus Nanoarchaeia archaeon]|nr:hypothetical protein [Candidatus Nanoarchaeia archaeon]
MDPRRLTSRSDTIELLLNERGYNAIYEFRGVFYVSPDAVAVAARRFLDIDIPSRMKMPTRATRITRAEGRCVEEGVAIPTYFTGRDKVEIDGEITTL